MKAVPGIRLFNIHFDFTIGECIRVYDLRVAINLQEWYIIRTASSHRSLV